MCDEEGGILIGDVRKTGPAALSQGLYCNVPKANSVWLRVVFAQNLTANLFE